MIIKHIRPFFVNRKDIHDTYIEQISKSVVNPAQGNLLLDSRV